MSYHTDSSMTLNILPGTPRSEVLDCFRDVIAHVKEEEPSFVTLDDLQVTARHQRDFDVWFDDATGEVGIFIDRDVSDGFEALMDEAAKKLSKLAVSGFYWEWSDQNSGDPEDNVKTPRFFGPTPEAKQQCEEEFMIEEVMSNISRVDYTDGKDLKNTRTALARLALNAIFAPRASSSKTVSLSYFEAPLFLTDAFVRQLTKLQAARAIAGVKSITAPWTIDLPCDEHRLEGEPYIVVNEESFSLQDGEFEMPDIPLAAFFDCFERATDSQSLVALDGCITFGLLPLPDAIETDLPSPGAA